MKLAGTVLEELWFAETGDEDDEVKASESMAAKLGELSGLKPFPVVAQKVLSVLNRSDFRVVEVTSVLEEDPSLTAGVLRVANSAFFAGAKSVSSVAQAFVRMGVMSVKESVLSVAMMDMFPDTGGLGKRIRDHCAATAAIVQTLARELATHHTEGIFLAGLMHDVGKLLLMETEEVVYDAADLATTLRPDHIHLDERALLGYDHAVLAGHVLTSWNIPDPIPTIVAWHHQATRAYEDHRLGGMVALLRIADHLEWAIAHSPENVEAFIDTFSKGVDCAFLHINATQLKRLVERLFVARSDALVMFGG